MVKGQTVVKFGIIHKGWVRIKAFNFSKLWPKSVCVVGMGGWMGGAGGIHKSRLVS